MEKENEEKKKKRYWLLLLLLLLLALIIFLIYFHLYYGNNTQELLHVSNTQVGITDEDRNKLEDDSIILAGHGEILINSKYPYVRLENSPGNDVYLRYAVYYDNKLLVTTDLISPGMCEKFNVFNLFEAGSYTLDYYVSAFDLESRIPYWSNVNIKQKIQIK